MTCRETLQAIETAVEDEGALRRLARQVATEEDLTADERDQLRGRIEFYLANMHLKLKVPGLLFLDEAEMTECERIALYALRALNRLERATVDEVVVDVRAQAERAGLLPAGQSANIDGVLIGRDVLMPWGRAQPPLVDADYARPSCCPTATCARARGASGG